MGLYAPRKYPEVTKQHLVFYREQSQILIVKSDSLADGQKKAEQANPETWVSYQFGPVINSIPVNVQPLLRAALKISQPHVKVQFDENWKQGSCSCEYHPRMVNGEQKPSLQTIYLPYGLVDAFGIREAFTLLAHKDSDCITYVDGEKYYNSYGKSWSWSEKSDRDQLPWMSPEQLTEK